MNKCKEQKKWTNEMIRQNKQTKSTNEMNEKNNKTNEIKGQNEWMK